MFSLDQVSHIPGLCPSVRGLAFVGSFCESLVSALHLAPKSVSGEGASIGSVDAVYRTEVSSLLMKNHHLITSSAGMSPRHSRVPFDRQ